MSETPVKNNSEQAIRSPKGRFVKGHSGNPAGRPPGAANKLLTLARDGALELWPSIMQAARDGNMEAVKLVLAAGMPKAKPVAETEPLPSFPAGGNLTEQAQEVLRAVAAGELSTDAAGALVSMLGTAARIDEVSQLREQVESLKRVLDARKDGKKK